MNATKTAVNDLDVTRLGSFAIVTPLTEAGTDWLDDQAHDESIWYAGGLLVEPRYVDGFIEAAREDGLTIDD